MAAHPPELELLIASCGWPHDDAALGRVCEAAGRVARWEVLEQLAAAHRVEPLVHHALAAGGAPVPAPVRAGLAARARAIATEDLRLAAETIRLQRAFDGAGIAMMALKGVAIGMLAYGRLGMKQSWDIDILVPAGRLVPARDLLEELGYRPAYRADQFDRFMAAAHEMEFVGANGMTVELHTRVARNPKMLAGIGASDAGQLVALPGGALRTLADAPLLAFLCVHGAMHQWARVKWLADVNAFVRSRRDTLEALVEDAARFGAHRSLAVALRLCRELFGTSLPATVERQLEDTWFTRLLARRSMPSAEIDRMPIVPSPLALALQVRAERGFSHAMGHLGSLWVQPVDRARIALPRAWRFLYHILRIPLMLERRVRRAANAASARRRAPAE